MKRIVIILVILAAYLPVSVNAQGTFTDPRFLTQAQYDALLVPVPVAPQATHFIDFGLPTETANTQEGWDYVTVGSLMPYRVDEPLQTNEMPSKNFRVDYMWLFTPEGAAARPVLKMPASTSELPTPPAATPATAAPFFAENEVSVRMPEEAGDVKLEQRVRYTFNNEEICPPDDPNMKREHTIRVVARPSIKLNKEDGKTPGDLETVSCVDEDVTIPTGTGPSAQLIVDGIADIAVQFSLTHKAIGANTTTDIATNQWLKLNGTALVFPGELFKAAGVYTIEFLNVSDRISRKSLDQVGVKAKDDLDMPEGGKYTVYILPKVDSVDKMEPVQHLRNMPL